ncbi:S1/P1 nuclease [Bacteriovorax sp. Seq25_V]|uniref:S1/P1 nuclease n=1 Tax=Bacteriovorax sp. Seq25_V TaxID=1201288 RepID=UPI000389F23F|nr:S1/P1 nuclease [Bacteriovorax sp. Seq25_V]EQC46911.1 S1/P1 Nuclease [Bacteriovorax sp. Seq25_V]
MKIFKVALLGAFSLNAFSWATNGHRIVGEVASHYVNKETKTQVSKILKGYSLADVANWADFIKSDPTWRKANPWHYVTIKDGQTYATSEKVKEGDVVWAINNFCGVLGNKKAKGQDREEALKFLVHFVGDIHQPLHVGTGKDRGGNDVELKWFKEDVNLHQVWDDHLIKMQDYSYTEYTKFLNHPVKSEIAKWKKSTIEDWIQDAVAQREAVYDIVKNSKDYAKYGEYKYNYNNIGNLNANLFKAGVRLAATIEKCLKNGKM